MEKTETVEKIFIDREEFKHVAIEVMQEIAEDPKITNGMTGLVLGLTAGIVANKIEEKLFGKKTESEV